MSDTPVVYALRVALEEACDRIDKLIRLVLQHGADPDTAIVEADLAEARNVYLRKVLESSSAVAKDGPVSTYGPP